MRTFAICALLLLTACGERAGQVAQFKAVVATWLQGRPNSTLAQLEASITPAQLNSLGRPILLVGIPARGVVGVLDRVDQKGPVELFWTPTRNAIALRDGLIISVAGLPDPLTGADVEYARKAIKTGQGTATRRYFHLEGHTQVVERVFTCTYRKETSTIVETCQAQTPFLPTNIENQYELDSDGTVRNSRQWVSNFLGYVQAKRID